MKKRAAGRKIGTAKGKASSKTPAVGALPSESAQRRLAREANLWLATTQSTGAPHLVPVWFTYVGGGLYICTECQTVKVRNIGRHPRVAVSLEGGDRPVIAFGRARLLARPWQEAVVVAFRHKYDWDLGEEDSSTCLLAIEPSRWLEW